MKTQIVKNIFKVVALAVMTLGLANCSKESSGSSTNSNDYYQMVGNQCYRMVNGQQVYEPNAYLCQQHYNTGGQQYVMQGNICYRVVNGQYHQEANTSLCYNNNYNNGWDYGYNNGYNNTYGQVCSGYFTDGMQTALCTPGAQGVQYQGSYLVMNCAGYTLYNQQTGQIVRCQ